MPPALPSLEDVLTLPPLAEIVVPPEWEDINGHVNVQYYLAIYERCTPGMLGQLGIGEDYVRERRFGVFDLSHHIRYIAEIHVGDRVTGHLRYVSRSAKRVLGVYFIVNHTRRRIASTIEFLAIGADLEARRAAPWPEVIATHLDALIDEHTALAWPVPLSGVLSS